MTNDMNDKILTQGEKAFRNSEIHKSRTLLTRLAAVLLVMIVGVQNVWGSMYNPGFNSPEFEGIKNAAGLSLIKLNQIAIQQMQVLNGNEGRNLLKE